MTPQSIEGAMPPLPEPYSAAAALGLDNLHTTDVVHAYAKAYAAPLLARVAELQADSRRMKAALLEARRAIGDHHAPDDCYATGPMTGNPIRDLVECPACSAIAMFDAALAAHKEQP